MPIKIIALDFDGVIVKSNQIKHEAFSELFKDFSEHYDEMMAYHYAHNAVDRHEKFRYIMENILKQEYDKELADIWAKKFSDMTRQRIVQCSYVKGAEDFIKYFYKKLPLYIASATPMDELSIILKQRKLFDYFEEAYGAPMLKADMFSKIVSGKAVASQDIVFVGDSYEDYKAAQKAGIFFLSVSSGFDFESVGVKNFKNMHGIKEFILSRLNSSDISE